MMECAETAHMDEAQNLRDQIKKIRLEAGMSVRDMAAAIGMSSSGYSHYEQRIKEPVLPYKIAVAIADAVAAAGVPRGRVMALAGADFVQHGPDGSAFPIEAKVARQQDDDRATGNRPCLVAVYDVSASAGHGMIVDEYEGIASRLSFPPNYLRHITTTSPEHLAIISVTGGSMTPTLHHDDIVMVDFTKKNISYDGMFCLRHDGLLKIKRPKWGPGRETIILHSDNEKEYPPEAVPVDEIEVVGRVVWVGAKKP